MSNKNAYNILFTGWLIALIASLGSLFFSEIMEFVPCTLCWYQRVFMYPLVFIFFVSIYKIEKNILLYAGPLIIIGWIFSFYHNLVQLKIIPEEASPCVQGIPCSIKYINWLGFITIPALSLFAFTLLIITMIVFYRRVYHEK
ncbi:MAG: disulfide oxidoreductase [Spirochaetia bacterium]|nr:disulfide oxidoreductase [Spirochaetia bacterium]